MADIQKLNVNSTTYDISTTWSKVTGKPSTFAPSSHTHTKSQITDFPSSMPASDVYSWAKAASKPTYTAAEVGLGNIANYGLYDSTHYSTSAGYAFINNGVMEVGNRIDFHSVAGSNDYEVSLRINSGENTKRKIYFPASEGTLALTSQIPTNTNQLTNGAGFITGITKSMVTTALGYTPPTSDTNTWRPVTNTYTGSDTSTCVSQKGTNDLYNSIPGMAFGTSVRYIGTSEDLNNYDVNKSGTYSSYDNKTYTNGPGYQNFGLIVGRLNTGYTYQLSLPYSTNSLKYRSNCWSGSGNVWLNWRTIIDSDNIGSYALTSLPSHTHTKSQITDFPTIPSYSTATSSTLGLVKIGYTANGKNYPVQLSNGQMYVNVPWTDTNTDTNTWRPVTNTYTGSDQSTCVSQYGTNALYNALVNGYASSAGTASNANAIASTGFGNSNFTYLQTSSEFFGNSGWAHYLISNHGDGSSYYNFTIGLPFWGVPIYKRLEGGTEDGWHTFITSENIGSQSVNYANSAGSAPASDVYSWAKASSKPSYTYSEVGAASSSHTHTSFANSITVTGSVSASSGFYQSSDERLKTFYDPIKVDLEKLKKLRKNYFKFNDRDELEIGVSAQEVQEIYPELVTSDDNGYLSVAYDKLSVIALAALDEQQKEIDDLKDQLSTIKNILKEKGIL